MAKQPTNHKRSKRDTDPDLTFASRQYLCCRSEWFGRNSLTRLNRSGILTVKNIEKLKQQLHLYPFADVELFGEAHIEIHERRRGEGIPSRRSIDTVEITVAVRVSAQGIEAAKVKTALHPKDAADLKLPGQFDQSVDLKYMIQSQS